MKYIARLSHYYDLAVYSIRFIMYLIANMTNNIFMRRQKHGHVSKVFILALSHSAKMVLRLS
jgi:hypothetical protein